MSFNAVLGDVINAVDDIKDKITDDDYLNITNKLGDIFKIKDNNLCEISYITTKVNRIDTNNYSIVPIKQKTIMKLTKDEFKHLSKKLKSDMFITACCDIVLVGIYDRIPNFNKHTDAVGRIHDPDLDDDEAEVVLYHRIIFCDCVKL